MLSIVVPTRDDEGALAATLASLLAQSEPGWFMGEHWEVLVVDDASGSENQSRTAAVCREFVGVALLPARVPLPKGFTGKANACQTGADAARGTWLLFTACGMLFQPGMLSRALVEADRYAAGVLSYGAKQTGGGLPERAMLPLVFSEIASAYPAAQVNDPARRIAYAAGEFLLVKAEAYRAVGGYAAVAASLVPEVDLAFRLKRNKTALRYRYAPELLERHTESSFAAFFARWTRKLALLIHNALALALWRCLDTVLLWGLLLLALLYPVPFPWERLVLWLLWARTVWRIYRRAARSGAAPADLLLSLVLGLPLFAVLLYASWYRARILRRVTWKGREYLVKGQA